MSALICQLFFTPDVGTWLHVELCQTDRSVSVLLTTKVMTVYCIGTVRKKQFSFILNFEMNKSTTAEKIKIKFSKYDFFWPFSEIFGGDSVKQLNKFVWPKNYLLKLIKPKWLPQRFQSHMKTDNTKRLVDPKNYQVWREF